MNAQEHFDVVVLRDPSASVGFNTGLARDLAHLTGVPQADVELALQHGRFVVHRALRGSQVRAATRGLAKLGAKFEVRPSAESLDIPAIEPDDEARGGAIGRFDGPLPAFSDDRRKSEPKIEAVDLPPPPPVRAAVEAEADLVAFQPTPLPTPAEQGLLDIVDQLEVASGDLGAVMTLDGVDNETFSAVEAQREVQSDQAHQEARRETPHAAVSDEPLAVDLPTHGPPSQDSLSLDVAAASSSSMASSSMASSSMASFSMASGPMSVPSYAQPRGAAPQEPLRPERGVFFEDVVSNYLAGVAAALLITLLAAFAITRASKRSAIVELEEEISVSYLKPVEVERGDMRAPSVIQDELEDLYGAANNQFLLILAAGIPIGLGVGRIRR